MWMSEKEGDRGGMPQKGKGVAKGMEEESGARSMTKDTGVLWKGHSRQGMPVRAGVAYEGGNSIIRGV